MTPVTKSFIPPIDEYIENVKRVFNNQWLTNRGELTLELEAKLMNYLNVSNILITNNGTIPLQIALKILGNSGEVITTPFSYVATTSSIVWENCIPKFVDIHPEYLTIDETQIEDQINSNTKCILATHVFGNPCNVESIGKIAEKYNLSVIYDAAHCFGVEYKNESVFNFGDISTCSFHATKIFHTAEGGAIFSNNIELRKKIFYSHNFGHNGPLDFHGLGINGKISEIQAAMGLTVLPYMSKIIEGRKRIVEFYLNNLKFHNFRTMKIREYTNWNYSYFPVIFDNEEILISVQQELNGLEIFPRRYFYPSLNLLPYVNYEKMTNSESISSRVLCLPLSNQIDFQILELICQTLNK